MELTNRQPIHTNNAPAAVGPYTHAIATQGLLFCSGQIALDPTTNTLTGTTAAQQTDQVMHNLDAIAKAAGARLADAVRCTIYLADVEDFQEVNDVYAKWFHTSPPARVTIGVAALPFDAVVEIDAVIALSN